METVIGSKTSVFAASSSREYDVLFSRDPELQAKYKVTGTGAAMLANRLSCFFDSRGPSITLDTACSSSLNALHLCCQSLRKPRVYDGTHVERCTAMNPSRLTTDRDWSVAVTFC